MLKKLLIFLFILGLCSVAGAVALYKWSLNQALVLPEEGLVVEIKKGQSLQQVLDGLEAKGALENQWPARIYARQHDLARQIKVGEFLLPHGSTVPDTLALFISNSQIRYRVTLIEGSTFAEALASLRASEDLSEHKKELSVDELWQHVLERVPEASIPREHPEGLLYPDTYFFHKGDSLLSILVRAHVRLLEVLDEEWLSRAKDLPLENAYEALTLASIVEKETGKPSERSEIAGVFVRRLLKNMRLQTDPTVIYGLGDRYQGNITRAHLKEKTAYNTYRINGLPPTPIALVGRDAIHAALNPKAGSSLYFVARGDGSHQFSETIDQHNRAVRKYQLKRRADYRSTHQLPKAAGE